MELIEIEKKHNLNLIFTCVTFVIACVALLGNIQIEEKEKLNSFKVEGLSQFPKGVEYICTSNVTVKELNCDICNWWAQGKGECVYK